MHRKAALEDAVRARRGGLTRIKRRLFIRSQLVYSLTALERHYDFTTIELPNLTAWFATTV
jgi:hypothetical protein